jgi:hypothetical protein
MKIWPRGCSSTPEPGPRGRTSWPQRSLAHPARAHRPRIVTTPWRRITPVSSARAHTFARAAECSSATSTITARREKRHTPAAAALVALGGGSWNRRGDRPCRECDSTGWVLYRAESADGGFEEAYRLCPEGCAPRYCVGSKDDRLCPRPATVRLEQVYYCEEHAAYRPR